MESREKSIDLPALDAVNQCLWRGDTALTLTPKAFALLCYLAERPRRLVTKEELLDAVWSGTHVTDGVLKVCVREIRRALDDPAKEPCFIETLHRRGYRFLVELPRRTGSDAAPVFERERDSTALREPAAPLVGRDDVLARLAAALRTATDGERKLVFVSGPPGIGKTSVVDALLRQVESGARVWIARGQCIEHYGAGEAYLPFLDAISRLSRGSQREQVLAWLARYAPTWLGPLGALADRRDREGLEREILGATPERMLREMAEAIEALSNQVPLVFVLEDLHWSDFSTLDLLALLGRRREPARLLVLGTYRHVEVLRANHPLKSVLRELSAHRLCDEIALDPLPAPAVDAYLAARFPGHAFPPALTAALYQRTEGQPLFLVNAVDFLVGRGSIVADGDRPRFVGDLRLFATEVPESIRQVIEMQVERLSAEEQAVLEAASVAGPEFSSASVAAALERDARFVEERCDALAKRRSFLRATGVAELPDGVVYARYAFEHALYANVLYHRLAPSQRARLHLRIGEGGERIWGARVIEIAGELALHFEIGHDLRRAVRHARAAADNDARRHANREALEHLVRAAALIDRLPEPERSALQLEVLEDLGLLRRSMGDMRGSSEAFEELWSVARDAGRRELCVRALLYLGSTLFWLDRERCLAAVDRALELSHGLDDELLVAHVRGYCGHWNLNLRGFDEQHVRAGALAIEAARKSGDGKLLSLHVVRYAYAQLLQGRYADAVRTTDEGSRLASSVGDAFDYLLCQFFRAWALLHGGDWSELQRTLQNASAMAEKNGHWLWLALFDLERAQLHVELGEFERARALCDAALEIVRNSREATGQIHFHGLIVLAAARLGQGWLAETGQCFAEIDQRLERRDGWMDWMLFMPLRRTRAEWLLARGDFAGARSEAELLREHAARAGEPTYTLLAARISLEAALAQGELAQADELVAKLDPRWTEWNAPLAAWRLQASLAALHRRKRRTREAAECERRSSELLEQLSRSLPESSSLGRPLRPRAGSAAKTRKPVARNVES